MLQKDIGNNGEISIHICDRFSILSYIKHIGVIHGRYGIDKGRNGKFETEEF